MLKLKNVPNCITSLRIAGTAAMVFFDPRSVWFYVVYALTGITDALDGFLARKLKITSDLGAKLDSIADLLFYAVMVLKILPKLIEVLPLAIWCTVGVTVLMRIASYLIAAVKYHRFASLHTVLNKLTGLLLFLVPFGLLLPSFWDVALCTMGCIVAFFASLEELIIHIKSSTYNQKTKTAFDE